MNKHSPRHLSALGLAVGLAWASGSAAQDLAQRSFLQLGNPPPNWRPIGSETSVVGQVAARDDGLVFVGGRELDLVRVIDARDPLAPVEICTFPMMADTCGLELDPSGTRLWIGGDDGELDADGLSYVDIPADPFDPACNFMPVAIPGVWSGAFPDLYVDGMGRQRVAIAGRACLPDPVTFVDPVSQAVLASWLPSNVRVRTMDVDVMTTSAGDTLAVVAADQAGIYLLDVTALPAPPVVVAHFDWTTTGPDLDNDPMTIEGCDRNGDGDALECGEDGRDGDGRRQNACSHAAFAVVDGTEYVVGLDGRLGGHVQVWSLADVMATCPGESNCPDDADCFSSLCNPRPAPLTCPPWPDVDRVPLIARYQLPKCPLAAWDILVEGDLLFIAHAEEGVHVIDLGEQGLPPTAGAMPVDLVALASHDTLPNDSDTVLENYPCHPIGMDDGCESRNEDWNPTPCQPTPPPTAAFRVVLNVGLGSALAVDRSGCHLYVTDIGTSDADGLPAPSHQGTPQGLWILGLGPSGVNVDLAPTLRIERTAGAPDALTVAWGNNPLVPEFRIHRGSLPATGMQGYDHACVARTGSGSVNLSGQVTVDPMTPEPGYYYLVNAGCDTLDGTTGADGFGMRRPAGTGTCP